MRPRVKLLWLLIKLINLFLISRNMSLFENRKKVLNPSTNAYTSICMYTVVLVVILLSWGSQKQYFGFTKKITEQHANCIRALLHLTCCKDYPTKSNNISLKGGVHRVQYNSHQHFSVGYNLCSRDANLDASFC